MVNFNGSLQLETFQSLESNRSFLYGDGVFETMKVLDRKILFLENHYFRLMSSMRVLRMEIPMFFTMEYLEEQVLRLIDFQKEQSSAYRIRITCYRSGAGFYLPEDRGIHYLIQANVLDNPMYVNYSGNYEMELYKDFYVTKQLLSSLKTTNRILNITASIFANENNYQNCFLLNEDKNVIEGIQANVFIVNDNIISTPPVSSGCVNGIMRKEIISLVEKQEQITIEERDISPFELQKADEIFLTNTIIGIHSVTKYRKKEYSSELANKLIGMLNAKIRFS